MFFFLGVVLTLIVTQLFFTSAPEITQPETTSKLTQVNSNEDKLDTSPLDMRPEPLEVIDQKSLQGPVFDPSYELKAVDYVVAHQVESVVSEFAAVVRGDSIKLKMLAELAGDMMRKDSLAAIDISTEIPVFFDYGLLDQDEATLDQDQLVQKEKVIEQWAKISNMKEQHRIEYEDAVKNLLTPDELSRYQMTEQKKVRQQLYGRANYVAKEVKVHLKDLDDYQKQELSRIVETIVDNGSDSIPIGYSLGGGAKDLSQDMAKVGKAFQIELAKILTDEQLDSMNQYPIMDLL